MTSPSAARRIPFWILTLGSLGVTGYGIWSVTNRLTTMESVLADGTATTADVYAGQAWVSVDAALIAGGLVGLALTLAVWAIGTRFGAAVVLTPEEQLAPVVPVDADEKPSGLEPLADEHVVVVDEDPAVERDAIASR